MKATKLITITTAILMLAFASFAAAQMGSGKMMRHGKGAGYEMKAEMAEYLELTDEQIERHKEIRLETQKQIIPLQADLKMARLELRELMSDGAAQSAVDAKIDEIGRIRTEMQKLRVGQHMQFREVLTEEQQNKLGKMPFSHGMRGRGGDCGHGRGHGAFGSRDYPMGGGGGPHFGDCPFDDEN